MYQLTDNPLQVIVLGGHPKLSAGTHIHSKSRFWFIYQGWLKTGVPRPAKPVGFYMWDGEAWVLDAKAVALDELTATDKDMTRVEESLFDAIVEINEGLVPVALEFQEPIVADKKAKRAKYLELNIGG